MTPRSIFCKPAGAENYFDPQTRICWHLGREWCRDDHKECERFVFGRCRSGRRWFWAVTTWRPAGQDFEHFYGWEDTEELAETAVRAAIINKTNGRPAMAWPSHGIASDQLKELNKVKCAQRPPSDATDSKLIEYLYRFGPKRHQIIKKTARRIYYLKQEEYLDRHGEPTGEKHPNNIDDDPISHRIGFVDRQKLEATGEVHCLYASLESVIRHYRDDKPIDLRQLKAEMAAAHPDRGGSSAAFIAAREKYQAALRTSRKSML